MKHVKGPVPFEVRLAIGHFGVRVRLMKSFKVISVWMIATGLGGGAWAETVYPPADWEPEPSPLASELAEEGGGIRVFASQYPKSFNYYLDQNVFSHKLFTMMYESLLGMDDLSLEPTPALASKVVISEDKKTFTFHLNPKAVWSDGKPVSAQDVVWTWEAILKPEHLTGAHKVSLSKFEKPQVLDDRTVRFVAKEVHWRNLVSLGGFYILPSHWWSKQAFNRVNTQFPVSSGPFVMGSLEESKSVVMIKRDDYWDRESPTGEGLANFDEVEFRFYGEQDLAFDNFRKGEFDVFAVHASHRWVAQTSGEKFEKNWIVKQTVHNYDPVSFQGFAMNLRREQFQDRRVRQALAHLLDRERLNATIMHNQYFLHRSFWEDLYDQAHPCPNQQIGFDVSKARALLKEAGWITNDGGKLEKNGSPFEITFLTRSADSDKFLIIYREALEQVGIELNIDRKDWSAWSKDMDEYNFDMTWAAWSGSVFKDPESMWHSKQKDIPSGFNITGYANPEIDAQIDAMREEFDIQKRNDILRKIDKQLTDDVPYVLLWNLDYKRMLYWNRFGMPDHVLGKFGDDGATRAYWWMDYDADADLEQAMTDGKKLPARPSKIVFDDVFSNTSVAEPVR